MRNYFHDFEGRSPVISIRSNSVFFQQASRSVLHKASIRGQYETVKMLLDNGEDVDQRDQVLFSFHLDKSNVRLLVHVLFFFYDHSFTTTVM